MCRCRRQPRSRRVARRAPLEPGEIDREGVAPMLCSSSFPRSRSRATGCAEQPTGAEVFGAENEIPGEPAYPSARPTAEQLQQLAAPIALYPDALVAQVLAGSTYPSEIVEADRWLQQHPDLKGSALAQAADQQSWDPSVKALTQFPSVLASMDRNLYWTTALGDAYVNQPQDLLDAVQTLRQGPCRRGPGRAAPSRP